jgi:polyketide synthase PksM
MKLVLDASNPLLRDHHVSGRAVLPGVAYLDLMFRAAMKAGGDFRTKELRNLVLYGPCTVPESGAVTLDVSIAAADDVMRVTVTGTEGRLATAELHPVAAGFPDVQLPEAWPGAATSEPLDRVYARCRDEGLVHGPFMQAIGDIVTGPAGSRCELRVGPDAARIASAFLFHPVLLDAAVLATSTLMDAVVPRRHGDLALPLIYGAFRAVAPLRDTCVAVCRRDSVRPGPAIVTTDIEFYDATGRLVAMLTGVVHKRAGVSAVAPATGATVDARVRAMFARALGLSPAEVDVHTGYYEQGLTSGQALSIVEELGRTFGREFPPTLLFEYTTLAALQAHLSAQGVESGRAAAEVSGGRVRDEEPVAVIGISGRYPQAASVRELWRNLVAGRDCITDIPSERWDATVLDGLVSSTGKPLSRWGGFVDHADCFDAKFFNISPREAELMDPQERLFLQAVWEVIEDAGYRPDTLVTPRGPDQRRRVGVFAGLMHNDYQGLASVENARGNPTPVVESYATVVNRVGYIFNFHGPNMAVDTACSSSLTAIHLAAESVRRGESDVAIAGGVNLSLNPDKYITYGMANMHSTDGRCRAFGAGGDGYVSGEGVGVVLLKPLSRAVQDGDRIYAVVLASDINHGGRASGVTVPNPTAQADVITACFEKAGVPARSITCIEAHGTGTSLGDPVECAGLIKAMRASTQDVGFCAIGSIKSNIGHAEGAAGVAGFTKLALQLHHQQLVPTLHAETLNPHIDFARSPFVVPRVSQRWERIGDVPRRGGISSFGAGGSNAHVVLEEAPARRSIGAEWSAPVLLVVSARTEEQRRQALEHLRDFLTSDDAAGTTMVSIARTLQLGRVPMEYRWAGVVSTREEATRRIEEWLAGSVTAQVWMGRAGRDAVAVPPDADTLDDWARAWVAGWEPRWAQLYPQGLSSPVSLPTYPFALTRHWITQVTPTPPSHPWIESGPSTETHARFSALLTGDAVYARGHRVAGRALLPGAMFLELARAAATAAHRGPMHGLRDLVWLRPLALDANETRVDIQVTDGAIEIAQGSTVLCRCTVKAHVAAPVPDVDLAAVRTRATRHLTGDQCYAEFSRQQLQYADTFRAIESIDCSAEESLARLRVAAVPGVAWHPGVIDGAFQSVLGLLLAGDALTTARTAPLVPYALDTAEMHRPLPQEAYAYARWHASGARSSCDILILDAQGRVCVELGGYHMRAIAGVEDEVWMGTSAWTPAPCHPDAAIEPVSIDVFAGDAATADALMPVHTDVACTVLPAADGPVDAAAERWHIPPSREPACGSPTCGSARLIGWRPSSKPSARCAPLSRCGIASRGSALFERCRRSHCLRRRRSGSAGCTGSPVGGADSVRCSRGICRANTTPPSS